MAVTRASLDNVWGPLTVDKWADLTNNGDQDHIDARVTWAITLATVEVRRRIATTVYVWSDVNTDVLVEHAISIKAGLLLYMNRSINDIVDGKTGSPVSQMTKMYDSFFAALSAGELFLGDEDAETNNNICAAYPFIVAPTRENMGLPNAAPDPLDDGLWYE